jgi:hypothetical protein
MKTSLKLSALLFALLALGLSGCHKTESNKTPSAMLMFHLHTNFDTSEAEDGVYYADPNLPGHNIQVTRGEYHLSNIKLLSSTGSWVSIPNVVLIKNDIEDYMVGNIPTGTYTSVSFSVGLPSTVNHTDPSGYPSDSILSPQTPSMHFSTKDQGYIFMAFEGKDSAGGSITNFNYYLGTDSMLTSVTMPDHSTAPFKAVDGGSVTVHMIADYAVLLGSLNPQGTGNASINSTVAGDHGKATTLTSHIPSMFIYEE